MTCTMITQKPATNISDSRSIIGPRNVLFPFLTDNILAILQLEALLLYTLLDLHNTARNALPSIETKTFPQLNRPEEIINESGWERIDVNNIENPKIVEQAAKKKGKKKKESAKGKNPNKQGQAPKRDSADKEEHLRRWEDCWEKKFQEEEERNQAECCIGKGLCVKPRTQSNIWINVTRDRSIEEIQMTFKHVPVSKPKPPPLPPLKVQKLTNDNSVPMQATNKKHSSVKKKANSKG